MYTHREREREREEWGITSIDGIQQILLEFWMRGRYSNKYQKTAAGYFSVLFLI